MKTLNKDRLFLIKFRLIRQIAMKLVYIHLECLLRDRMLSRKKKLPDIIATFATRDFRDFFFPQQLAFRLTFQLRLKCNYGPFWHFSFSTLFTAWAFFEFAIRNCKILVQSFKALPDYKFLQYFDFWSFMTFNSRDLSFKSRRKLLVTYFKFSSRDTFLTYLKLIS